MISSENIKNYSSNFFIMGNNCNNNCYYCYSKQKILDDTSSKYYTEFNGFDTYINNLISHNVQYITITGHNYDPFQYKYLYDLIHYLKNSLGYPIRLETNGCLFHNNINILGTFDIINLSIKSLNNSACRSICGYNSLSIDNIKYINAYNNVSISVVINKYNYNTIIDDINHIWLNTNINRFYLRPDFLDNNSKIYYNFVLKYSEYLDKNIIINGLYESKTIKINYYSTGSLLIGKFLLDFKSGNYY